MLFERGRGIKWIEMMSVRKYFTAQSVISFWIGCKIILLPDWFCKTSLFYIFIHASPVTFKLASSQKTSFLASAQMVTCSCSHTLLRIAKGGSVVLCCVVFALTLSYIFRPFFKFREEVSLSYPGWDQSFHLLASASQSSGIYSCVPPCLSAFNFLFLELGIEAGPYTG